MIINLIFLFLCSLIEIIKSGSSNNTDSNFWNDNLWLFILLIILSVALIILIVFISIKIYHKFKSANKKENENNFVNTERSSQKYISDYDKLGQNNKKIKYKQRPLKEIEEE